MRVCNWQCSTFLIRNRNDDDDDDADDGLDCRRCRRRRRRFSTDVAAVETLSVDGDVLCYEIVVAIYFDF